MTAMTILSRITYITLSHTSQQKQVCDKYRYYIGILHGNQRHIVLFKYLRIFIASIFKPPWSKSNRETNLDVRHQEGS